MMFGWSKIRMASASPARIAIIGIFFSARSRPRALYLTGTSASGTASLSTEAGSDAGIETESMLSFCDGDSAGKFVSSHRKTLAVAPSPSFCRIRYRSLSSSLS